jgi:uncharacterized protein
MIPYRFAHITNNCMSMIAETPLPPPQASMEEAILVKSAYLQKLELGKEGKSMLYHTLFGNIHQVSEFHIDVIDLFSKPQSLARVLRQCDDNQEAFLAVIDQFMDAFFLIPEGFDERSLVERELIERSTALETGKTIDAVQLNVSEGCNLKCTYCFADRVDERSSTSNFAARNEQKFMSIGTAMESITAVEALIRRNGGSAMVIKFFGREPLLNWPVVEAVIDQCESMADKNFKFHYAITTNGTLFTPEIVRKFQAVNMMTVISLDGLQESNLARITHDGKESFSMVDRGLKLLKEENLPCSVASVLSEQNFDLLDVSFIDYLVSRSVKQWEVKLAMQNGVLSVGETERTAMDYTEKLMSLYNYAKGLGVGMSGDWYDPFAALFHTTRKTKDKIVHRLLPNSCGATDHQLSIEPSGNVFGCRALEEKIGEVSSLEEIFKNPRYQNLAMRTFYNVPMCRGCKLEGFCQGVCLGHSEKGFGNIYTPDVKYCDIYRLAFDYLLKGESHE